jgi:hypothetical protein
MQQYFFELRINLTLDLPYVKGFTTPKNPVTIFPLFALIYFNNLSNSQKNYTL